MTGARLARLVAGYLLGGGIFLVCIPWLALYCARLVDRLLALPQPFSPVVGLGVFIPLVAFGLFWAAWSNVYLMVKGRGGPAETFGVAVSPPTQRLVVSGPYRYTRNPMVFGALTVYLSTGFLFRSISLLVIMFPILCLLSYVVIAWGEERRLQREFGEEYSLYRQRVPRYLPLPWRWRQR